MSTTPRERHGKIRAVRWLQRLCIWVLGKLECTPVVPEHEPLEQEPDVLDRIFTARYLAREYGAHGDLVLFLGQSQYLAIKKNDTNIVQFFESTSTLSPIVSIYGMPVVVIPWINDVLVVPLERVKEISRK